MSANIVLIEIACTPSRRVVDVVQNPIHEMGWIDARRELGRWDDDESDEWYQNEAWYQLEVQMMLEAAEARELHYENLQEQVDSLKPRRVLLTESEEEDKKWKRSDLKTWKRNRRHQYRVN